MRTNVVTKTKSLDGLIISSINIKEVVYRMAESNYEGTSNCNYHEQDIRNGDECVCNSVTTGERCDCHSDYD